MFNVPVSTSTSIIPMVLIRPFQGEERATGTHSPVINLSKILALSSHLTCKQVRFILSIYLLRTLCPQRFDLNGQGKGSVDVR